MHPCHARHQLATRFDNPVKRLDPRDAHLGYRLETPKVPSLPRRCDHGGLLKRELLGWRQALALSMRSIGAAHIRKLDANLLGCGNGCGGISPEETLVMLILPARECHSEKAQDKEADGGGDAFDHHRLVCASRRPSRLRPR